LGSLAAARVGPVPQLWGVERWGGALRSNDSEIVVHRQSAIPRLQPRGVENLDLAQDQSFLSMHRNSPPRLDLRQVENFVDQGESLAGQIWAASIASYVHLRSR
jgi:hypothetical protein